MMGHSRVETGPKTRKYEKCQFSLVKVVFLEQDCLHFYTFWPVLTPTRRQLDRSWSHLEASRRDLGAILGYHGRCWGHLGGLVGPKNGQHKRQQVPSGENREEDVKKKAVYVGHSFGTTENNEKAKKIESRKPEKTIVKRAFFKKWRRRPGTPRAETRRRNHSARTPKSRPWGGGKGVG